MTQHLEGDQSAERINLEAIAEEEERYRAWLRRALGSKALE